MERPSLSRVRGYRAHRAQHVRNLIEEAILAGTYGDAPLPDEATLATQLGVSRNVVRDALDQLRRESYLVRLQGSGTYPLPPKRPHRFDALVGLQDTFGSGVTYEKVTLDIISAGPGLGTALQTDSDADIYHLERVASVDGNRVAVMSTYLPCRLLPELPRLDIQQFRRALGDAGLTPERADVRMSAVSADPAVAALLGVEVGSPLLAVRRVLYCDDRPIEVGHTRYRTETITAWCEQHPLPGGATS